MSVKRRPVDRLGTCSRIDVGVPLLHVAALPVDGWYALILLMSCNRHDEVNRIAFVAATLISSSLVPGYRH